MAVEAYAIWKLFSMYSKLQEQRLEEWKNMVENYNTLVKDINKTLDTLLQVIGKNGTGTK